MKPSPCLNSKKGLTLLELVVVLLAFAMICAIFIFAPRSGAKAKAESVQCMSNQRQINLRLQVWKDDHAGQYPWEVSITNKGTCEWVTNASAATQFRVLADVSSRYDRIYRCPTDKVRMETNYEAMTDLNISYFLCIDPSTNRIGILTGDRHLQVKEKPVAPGLFVFEPKTHLTLRWTSELHKGGRSGPIGVISFTDGHVELVSDERLPEVLKREDLKSKRLLVP